jgi:hypothetical protein
MPLIKVRNKGNNILFIDSLGLTLRPRMKTNDFFLVDELKAKNDTQFMKCVMVGSIEICSIDKEFVDVTKVLDVKSSEPISEVSIKDDHVNDSQKISEENKDVKKASKKKTKSVNSKSKNDPVVIEESVEQPTKNYDSVIVVPGGQGKEVNTVKVKSYKLLDTPLPDFITKNDIRDMKDSDVDEESRGENDIDLSKFDDV